MNNIVILNASQLSEYAWKELYQGRNSVEIAVEAAGLMPDTVKKAVILPDKGPDAMFDCGVFEGFELCKTKAGAVKEDAAHLVETLIGLSEGFDNIIYFHADCPLVDTGLAAEMYANHCKYFCEYTFADGYPAGISVEIIKTGILPMLSKLAESETHSDGRNTLFKLIEKDINSFEIETEISPDDQRLLRVSLYPDTRRNFEQLRSVYAEVRSAVSDKKPDSDAIAPVILDIIRNKGHILRKLPVFFEFETTAVHPQKVAYMPPPWNRGGNPDKAEMAVDSFKTALSKIQDFCGDAVISLSIRNEPGVHSSSSELAAAVLEHPDFSLLIETSGIGWNQQQYEKICSMDQNRITWIIDLDAYDKTLYGELRGSSSDHGAAYAFAEKMVSEHPGNTWVQLVRMKKNEEDTELFYKYWKERTKNVIIQKYDWCCGRLEQLKVTDLSPVKRLPCWHLKREIAVLSDGTVPVCRDDLECGINCGNIFKDDLKTVWERGESLYRHHLDEEYPGICRNCDEYYTYNY